jgi:hypothetical protein
MAICVDAVRQALDHEETPESLASQKVTLLTLLDRAASDPEFLAALAANPLETALAAGLRFTAADLKRILDIAAASDYDLVEMLQMRLQQKPRSCGCGG